MTSVKKWEELGYYYSGLGVPRAVIKKIQSNTAYKTVEEKKEALLLYYLHTVARASWQNVAGALHWMEEVTALKAVNVFLQSTPAGELIFQGTEIICMFGKYPFQVDECCGLKWRPRRICVHNFLGCV